jgi:integrase
LPNPVTSCGVCIHRVEEHFLRDDGTRGKCILHKCDCPGYKRGRCTFRRETLTTEGEVLSMLNRAREWWVQALVVVLYLYGARISEALELRKEDVVVEGKYLVINFPILKKRMDTGPYGTPKHRLRVPLTAPFVDQVIVKQVGQFSDRDRLFPYTRVTAWKKIKELRPDGAISPHVFRHDRLSKFALAGESPYKVQAWAGWSDQRPIKNYVHLFEEDLKDMGEKVR